jgi:hypothetical protein
MLQLEVRCEMKYEEYSSTNDDQHSMPGIEQRCEVDRDQARRELTGKIKGQRRAESEKSYEYMSDAAKSDTPDLVVHYKMEGEGWGEKLFEMVPSRGKAIEINISHYLDYLCPSSDGS